VQERGYDAFSTKILARTAVRVDQARKGLVGEGSAAFRASSDHQLGRGA
jgi:hypothetical protein